MVTDRLEPAVLVLPAASVALAVNVCEPEPRAEEVMLQLPLPSAVVVPRTVVPSVSNSLTMALASDVPVKAGVVLLVMLSVLDVPESVPAVMSGADGAAGAAVSMVTARVETAPPGVAEAVMRFVFLASDPEPVA